MNLQKRDLLIKYILSYVHVPRYLAGKFRSVLECSEAGLRAMYVIIIIFINAEYFTHQTSDSVACLNHRTWIYHMIS